MRGTTQPRRVQLQCGGEAAGEEPAGEHKLALDWEVPVFTGNADFGKMGDVGSDDYKTVRLGNCSDAAVLRAGAFDGSRKATENMGGFIVIAQDGSAVQFTHKVEEVVVSKG